jgi:general secretion pathway protein N
MKPATMCINPALVADGFLYNGFLHDERARGRRQPIAFAPPDAEHMISNPRIGLSLLGLVMCILALEWFAPLPAAPMPAAEAHALAITQFTPARRRRGTLGHYVASISARPLFAPDRRPVPQQHSGRTGMSQGLPRLAGIVIAASRRRAIFEDDGKAIVRGAGGDLDGYRIVAINALGVTLRGPAGQHTVSVSFDENRTVPPPFIYRMAPSRPSILDQLNTQAPPSFPVPRPPDLRSMLARQRQAQQ